MWRTERNRLFRRRNLLFAIFVFGFLVLIAFVLWNWPSAGETVPSWLIESTPATLSDGEDPLEVSAEQTTATLVFFILNFWMIGWISVVAAVVGLSIATLLQRQPTRWIRILCIGCLPVTLIVLIIIKHRLKWLDFDILLAVFLLTGYMSWEWQSRQQLPTRETPQFVTTHGYGQTPPPVV